MPQIVNYLEQGLSFTVCVLHLAQWGLSLAYKRNVGEWGWA